MIKIGILGDIGSGKTFIAKKFGYPVFNADLEVNKIYKNNKIIYKKLKKKIPKYIYSFPIKKKEIGNAILGKKNNLNKIIKIIHPIIRTKMNFFFKKNKNKKIVILDIPLLIENKLNKKNYILIFVQANKKDILRRLKKRKNYNPKLFSKLRKLQLSLEIKKRKSNYVIKNNFKSFSIIKSVKILKESILKK
ncbi:MAG: dephospho-CoA kinase [Candidatus Pelagibacter sp.]|nr:dephospho-CoA kinase [Candidatus Pelagibacter sp.]|tara:strand:+ start:678 stop:1253 length:576 start_codon:yes stop_codon:yes gene_type:complete